MGEEERGKATVLVQKALETNSCSFMYSDQQPLEPWTRGLRPCTWLYCALEKLCRGGISVPCFSLHKYRSLCSLPSAALLSLAKGLMQGWGEAPAWPFSGSCTGMDLQHLHTGPCPGRYLSHRPQPTTTLEAEQEGEWSPGRPLLLLLQMHLLCG